MALESNPVKIKIDGTQYQFDLDVPELPEWVADVAFASGDYPHDRRLKRRHYEKQLYPLQKELVKLQHWMRQTGERIIIVFEGRDAAGKGGAIDALRRNLNPRHTRTIALSKPNEVEQGQWYFQRYIDHFPTEGEMILFDRSWYNRAGVEPVMGFCTQQQHEKFLADAPAFEQMVVDEGYRFFKFWINVGQEMQLKRFHQRRHDPLKNWKLSPIDLAALAKWDDYSQARDRMLAATHTQKAPWNVVRSNDKRRARINIIRKVLLSLDYDGRNDTEIGELDPLVIGQGPEFLNAKGA